MPPERSRRREAVDSIVMEDAKLHPLIPQRGDGYASRGG